jgi:outer membrane protein OmpA-like peptidoglycan-associated protein
MSMLKNSTQSNDIVDENRESSSPAPEARSRVRGLQLAVPGAAFLATLGLLGYAIWAGSAADQARVQPASRAAQTGDFLPQAGWIKNLEAQLSVFSYESASTQFSGTGESFAVVPPTGLPRFVAASMTGSGPGNIRLALSMPATSQNSKAPAEKLNLSALNSLSIEFPGNSARIPTNSFELITKVAKEIKALPSGTVVELIGYTAGGGQKARSTILARKRANSVYAALIRAGVDPAMLRPKGDGSATIEASTGPELEGRSSTARETRQRRDRRVEFRVIEPQR